jgi:anthranilate phosphoribosyltransferase
VVRRYELTPADFGLDACEPVSLLGGTVRDNAQIILTVFAGAKGPRHDIVCANAALALRLAGRTETLTEGFAMASEALSSGGAMRKLNALREFTQAAALSE